MRFVPFVVGALMLGACGGAKSSTDSGDEVDADPGPPDACEGGLGCFIVDCNSKVLPPTSISGTVYAPNGTLPLYGVDVYIPETDPGPLVEGVTCGNCGAALQGGAWSQAKTDEMGHFVLQNVPATDNVPLVIQTGKWRRQITIPTVSACQDTALAATETHLPRTKTEGDIPKIAISTGDADALECLIHKLGIDDTEFTTDAGAGRVNLFEGDGTSSFMAGYPGGSGAFPDSETLWASKEKLSNYDIVVLSCEGSQEPDGNGNGSSVKTMASLQAMHDYTDVGGRLFLSHWHNIWVGGKKDDATIELPDWKAVGTFNYNAPQDLDNTTAIVDETVPKGDKFATWLDNVMASTTHGQIPISGARYTLMDRDPVKGDRRVYAAADATHTSVQDLEFSTPQTVEPEQRCGKVVFSDMHVSSDSRSVPDGSTDPLPTPFPTGCSTGDLTPQEKVLAFLFFDISSCVGVVN